MKNLISTLICLAGLFFPTLSAQVSAQEPPSTFAIEADQQLPELDEILKDKEFVKLYEQMTGQKLSPGTQAVPAAPATFSETPPWSMGSFQAPPISDPTQNLPPEDAIQSLIAMQQLHQLDRVKALIMNDIQNTKTCGYRGIRFEPSESVHPAGGATFPLDVELHYDVQTDFQPQRYIDSPNNFHWAIVGEGFFVLRKQPHPSDANTTAADEDTLYYTRAGRFELTADRKLGLDHHGETYLLQPETEIPPLVGDYEIREGCFCVVLPDGSRKKLLELQLAQFDRPERLHRIDGVMFFSPSDAEKPVLTKPSDESGTTVRLREYEASNVDFAKLFSAYRTLHRMQTAILGSLMPYCAGEKK